MIQATKDYYINIIRKHQWEDAIDFMPRWVYPQSQGEKWNLDDEEFNLSEINEILSYLDFESISQNTKIDSETGNFTISDLRYIFILIRDNLNPLPTF